MNFSQSLDKYLTTPFENDFEGYYELVLESFTDSFFDSYEDDVLSEDGQICHWIEKLYCKDVEYEKTANIIERAYKLYLLTPTH